MLTLSTADIKTLLAMPQAIELVEAAMITVSNGGATLPLRHAMPLDAPNMLGIMPGVMSDPACYGTKLISLYPDNPAQGHSSHLGLMVLFEREFGQPTAIMNAGVLTAIRTAAASAVATRALAREGANVLAIVGTGEQARYHLDSMCAVRPISELRCVGRNTSKAEAFAAQAGQKYPDISVIVANDIKSAVLGADIICTVTSSKDTVLKGAWVASGAHVNAVGASIPTMREIDEEMVTRASLYVDYRPSALAQARDIIEALESGVITEDHIIAEIGEVLGSRARGRQSSTEITLYRSMGIAAQDLICAHYVMEQAKAQGLGLQVSIL